VQLELGGKNTSIVSADAVLPEAARDIAMAAFGFAGQKCTATSRVLVVKDVADELVELLAAQIAALPVGEPADEATVCGPVISERKADELRAVVQGLDVAATANVPENGRVVAPRLVRDVPLDHDVWTTELFGPVLAVRTVDDVADAFSAVTEAADGLALGLYTSSSALVHHAARSLRAGVIAVNRPTTGLDPHVPFGGTGRTSAGPREQGPDAMNFYTEERTVYWRETR
jgi:aldehyde dehydrogenase (NAD+)